MRLCPSNNLVQNLKVGDHPSGQICRVLNFDEARRRAKPSIWLDDRLDMLPCENSILRGHCANQAPGKDCRRGHLIIENVRSRLGNHFLAGLRQGANRNLVSHGACGHKQRCLAAKRLRRAPLQQVDRGILAVNVVADFSRSHRRAHLQRRLGYRVRTQINDCWQWGLTFLE